MALKPSTWREPERRCQPHDRDALMIAGFGIVLCLVTAVLGVML